MGTERDAHADYVLLADDSETGSGRQEAATAPRRSARVAATQPASHVADVRQPSTRHDKWAAARQQALTRLAAAKRNRAAHFLSEDSEEDKSERPLASPSKPPRGRAQLLLSSSSSEDDDSNQLKQPSQPATGVRAGDLPGSHAPLGSRRATRGQGAAAAAADDPGTDEQSPISKRPSRRPPRAARAGRQAANFLAGGRDYTQSDSDADLDDFIADEDLESREHWQHDRQLSSPAGSSPPSSSSEPAGSGGSEGMTPAAAAAAAATSDMRPGSRRSRWSRRRVAARLVESSSEEDEIPAAASGPTTAAAAAAVATTAAGRGGQSLLAGEAGPEPPRKRLRKGVIGGVLTPSGLPSPGEQPSVLLQEPLGLEPDKALADTRMCRPVRRARAAATAAASLPAAERIRRAQQRWQQGQDDFSARHTSSSCDASSSDSDGSGSYSMQSGGQSREIALGSDREEGATLRGAPAPALATAAMAAAPGMTAAAPGGAPHSRKGSRHKEASWQQAAAGVLGLGSYSEEELFRIYVEYQLLCLVDPGYAEAVSESPQHREYYSRAMSKVEGELALKREAVASAAWVSSDRGLLVALETLPGIATDWANDDGGGENWDVTCAACNRRRSHATRLLILKGRPLDAATTATTTTVGVSGTPAHQRQRPFPAAATPASHGRSLAQQLMLVSPTFRRRNAPCSDVETEGESESGSEGGRGMDLARAGREDGQGDRPSGRADDEGAALDGETEGLGEAAAPRDNPDTWRRAEFPVGRYCCARLALYHALFHWRHRLLARLKRELKAELRRRKRQGQARERNVVADALLAKDSLLTDLHRNYRMLLQLSESYQLSGGEGSAQGWRSEFNGMHAEVTAALYELHCDSEGEESSVAWPDERASDSEARSGRESASTGSDSDAEPSSQHALGASAAYQRTLHSGRGGSAAAGPWASRHGWHQSQQRQPQQQQRAGGSTGDASADRLLSMLRAAAASAPAPAGGASPLEATEPPPRVSQEDSPDARRAWQAAQPQLLAVSVTVVPLPLQLPLQHWPPAAGRTATATAGGLALQSVPVGRAGTGAAPAAGHAGAGSGHGGLPTNHSGQQQTLLEAVRAAASPKVSALGLRTAVLNPSQHDPSNGQQQQQGADRKGGPTNVPPSICVPSPSRVQQQQQHELATTPRRLPPLGPVKAPASGASGSKGSGLKQVGIRSFFGPSPPGSSVTAALSPAELAALGASGGKTGGHEGGIPKAGGSTVQGQKAGGSGGGAAQEQQQQPAGARVGWRPRGLGEALDRAAGA
ncbi:hypothetical protein N2152v2_006892 [Parachlorella kessleri]